jgi:hypothetical protein
MGFPPLPVAFTNKKAGSPFSGNPAISLLETRGFRPRLAGGFGCLPVDVSDLRYNLLKNFVNRYIYSFLPRLFFSDSYILENQSDLKNGS